MPQARLDVVDVYRRMTGTGEIQIDDAGYPIYIRLDLDLGTQPTGEQIVATLDMFYSDYQQPVSNPTAVWFTPAGVNQTLTQAAQNPNLPNTLRSLLLSSSSQQLWR